MSGPAQERWLLLRSGAGGAAFNMALDEALMEASTRLAIPVLRFYEWAESAASFGYSQRVTEVERLTRLRPLIRRPTGGGVVPHDADWTYSVILPPGHTWYQLRAVASYQRVHEWIREAFGKLGLKTELAASCRKEMPGQCFVGHEKYDVLSLGGKVAGAAQRRNRSGLLIQGSVQAPTKTLARSDWEEAMIGTAREMWGVEWTSFELDAALRQRAGSLAKEKYSRDEYNRRR
jgi:lipoate-protein ligase A